ncbi:hypothetical protein D7W82_05970 [Corallococcus sp. CA049B]|nr:hypothetical protein D7W82_05970 [Corallococcus sp. CA049B]
MATSHTQAPTVHPSPSASRGSSPEPRADTCPSPIPAPRHRPPAGPRPRFEVFAPATRHGQCPRGSTGTDPRCETLTALHATGPR